MWWSTLWGGGETGLISSQTGAVTLLSSLYLRCFLHSNALCRVLGDHGLWVDGLNEV